MDQECGGPNRAVKQEEGLLNGAQEEVDNANAMAEREESTGSVPGPICLGAKPKRLRSKAWDDFTPIYIDGKVARAECMHCHQVFNSSGTGNLLKHQAKCSPRPKKRPMQQKLPVLPSIEKSMAPAVFDSTQKKLLPLLNSQKKCPDAADDMPDKKTLALPDIPTDKDPRKQSHEEFAAPEQDIRTDVDRKNLKVDQNSHEELARIWAAHGYPPPSRRPHDRFRKFLACLNPIVKMPAEVNMYTYFMELFDKEKAKLKEKFAALHSRVCLSAYVWHYDPFLAFLCLSIHYIDDHWERQQKIITFRKVDPSCSAESLSNVILRAIHDWGLDGKIFCIILDDAFIDDSVTSNVKTRLQEWNSRYANNNSSVPANRSLFVLRYATDLLNKVMQVGKDELEKVMEKSAKCSKTIKGSTSSVVRYPNRRYAPSPKAWSNAQNICKILDGLHQCMNKIHNCRSPVDLFDRLWDVRDVFPRDNIHYFWDDSISDEVKEMRERFKKYWKVCYLNICMPMIMDPSCRLKHIKSSLSHYLNNYALRHEFDREIEDYVQEAHDTLLNLFYEYSEQAERASCTSGADTSKRTFVKGDDTLMHFYHLSEYPYSEPMTELDQYIYWQEPGLATGEPSLLQWWKEHSLTYPTISRMARDILAIPLSADSNVLATKTARRIFCQSESTFWIEKLVCTQNWLRPNGSGSEMSSSDISQ